MKNPAFDVWAHPQLIDSIEAEKLAKFLEERAQFFDQIQINEELIEILKARPGEDWLEIGCGSGVLSRYLAKQISPAGHVTGVDLSSEMINVAQQYRDVEGLDSCISFQNEDGCSLSFPDGEFDGVFTTRTLLHVSNPDAVLKEMKRVTKKSGKLVAMEWDFDTVTIDNSDRLLTRKILHWRTDNKDGNNWSGRQLWRRAVQANWEDITITPFVSIVNDENTSLAQSIIKAANGAQENEVISENDCQKWLKEIKQQFQNGTFFASIIYFIVQGNS